MTAVEEIFSELNERKRNFEETIELQVQLQNYDFRKDKRFTGTVELPYTTRRSCFVCVFGDTHHCEEAMRIGVDYKTLAELQGIGRNKKLIKSLFRKYHFLLASESLIRTIPRMLGPTLNKMGKFPSLITHSDNLELTVSKLTRSVRIIARREPHLGFAIGNRTMKPNEIIIQITVVVSYLVALLKHKWDSIRSLNIKSTMGKNHTIYESNSYTVRH
jgi:large subunit ribosomal protein L10Ae